MTSTTTTTSRTYKVVVHRETHPEGSWWVFDIPDLGAVGQATGLADVGSELADVGSELADVGSELADVGSEARGIIAAWDEDGPAEDDIHATVRLGGPPVQGRR